MTIKLSTAVRTARMGAIEGAVGTSPILRIYTGSPPANITDAASGTLLATMTLPSDWLGTASSGSVSKAAGAWETGAGGANATGDAGYFRIWNSGLTTAHVQGNVTVTSGGGDMEFANITITQYKTVYVNAFTLTDDNV